MSFTGAAGSAKDQPAFRLGGESPGRLIGAAELLLGAAVAAPAFRHEIFKGKTRQRAQIAVPFQARLKLFILLGFNAAAGDDTAIVRLPRGEAGVNDPGAFAERAIRAFRRRFISGGPCVRIFL